MTGVTGMTGMTGIARITLTTRLQGLYPYLNKKKIKDISRTFKDTFPVFQTQSVFFYFFQNINPILIFVQKD